MRHCILLFYTKPILSGNVFNSIKLSIKRLMILKNNVVE